LFDNVDALAPRLSDSAAEQLASTGIYPRILSQLVREIDDLGDVKGVILLAATNRLERVDPVLLRSGRFDYVVQFPLPDAAAREAIARFCCRRAPLAADVDLLEVVRRTDGRTGADVESACRKAMFVAIDRHRRSGSERPFEIQQKDFEFLEQKSS
jgi:transitional endoplasmic reticulum ATPase